MPRKIRPIRVRGDVAFVSLTQGREAAIDVCDAPYVERFNWYAWIPKRKDGSVAGIYAGRIATLEDGSKRQVLMHREILMPSPSLLVDHKDGNGLNNRRDNLRQATRTQNAQNSKMRRSNSSGFKGVCWDKVSESWKAYITIDGKRMHLGLFTRKVDAAKAYADASILGHGEFSRLE
jgi:hypothetical protein